jgi:uncharacterized protein
VAPILHNAAVIGVLSLLAVGLALLWLGAVAYIARMLTHPPRRTYASAVAKGWPGDPGELDAPRRFESWTFRSRGLELPAWEIPGDDPGGPTVILTHGWADSRIGALARVEALAPVASRIIAWDLPGHGSAPGCSALGWGEAADLLALVDSRAAAGGLALYGWSLGAGVSILAAAHAKPLAVIAESPYRFAATPARNVLVARGLPHRAVLAPALAIARAAVGRGRGDAGAPFDRAFHAGRLGCPLLVLHGRDDEICPIVDGRDIASAAPRGRIVEIEGGHHNDLWTDAALAARCSEAVRAFIREVGAAPACDR